MPTGQRVSETGELRNLSKAVNSARVNEVDMQMLACVEAMLTASSTSM